MDGKHLTFDKGCPYGNDLSLGAENHVQTVGMSGLAIRKSTAENVDMWTNPPFTPFDCKGSGVYVVKCQEFCKIGKTKDMPPRFSTIQISVPFELEIVVWLHRHSIREAASLEKELHRVFARRHVRGEWYHLLDEDFSKLEYYNNFAYSEDR